jgi:uncharacterized protein YjeT (DUF2065 family)
MKFNLFLFLAALGVACIMEALPWILSPQRMRATLQELFKLSDERLRMGGIFMLALGLLICAAGRYFRGV